MPFEDRRVDYYQLPIAREDIHFLASWEDLARHEEELLRVGGWLWGLCPHQDPPGLTLHPIPPQTPPQSKAPIPAHSEDSGPKAQASGTCPQAFGAAPPPPQHCTPALWLVFPSMQTDGQPRARPSPGPIQAHRASQAPPTETASPRLHSQGSRGTVALAAALRRPGGSSPAHPSSLQPGQVVGVDLEWRPSFGTGGRPQASIMQVAVEGRVFLLDVPVLSRPAGGQVSQAFSRMVSQLLSDPSITKLGEQSPCPPRGRVLGRGQGPFLKCLSR